jgi:hypothetical protein
MSGSSLGSYVHRINARECEVCGDLDSGNDCRSCRIAELEAEKAEAQRSEAYHIQKLNFITEKYNAMLARCEEDPPYFWRTRTTRDDAWYQAMEHVKGEGIQIK